MPSSAGPHFLTLCSIYSSFCSLSSSSSLTLREGAPFPQSFFPLCPVSPSLCCSPQPLHSPLILFSIFILPSLTSSPSLHSSQFPLHWVSPCSYFPPKWRFQLQFGRFLEFWGQNLGNVKLVGRGEVTTSPAMMRDLLPAALSFYCCLLEWWGKINQQETPSGQQFDITSSFPLERKTCCCWRSPHTHVSAPGLPPVARHGQATLGGEKTLIWDVTTDISSSKGAIFSTGTKHCSLEISCHFARTPSVTSRLTWLNQTPCRHHLGVLQQSTHNPISPHDAMYRYSRYWSSKCDV